MTLTVNGDAVDYDGEATLTAFLESQERRAGTFAVAVNGEFVPRGKYAETRLTDGDDIEIVAPMQGG